MDEVPSSNKWQTQYVGLLMKFSVRSLMYSVRGFFFLGLTVNPRDATVLISNPNKKINYLILSLPVNLKTVFDMLHSSPIM